MVQIKPKRPHQPVPFLQGLISSVLDAKTDEEIQKVLHQFEPPNHFERPEERNLLSWCKVLNRFDFLLERYISERDILVKEFDNEASESANGSGRTVNVAETSRVPSGSQLTSMRNSNSSHSPHPRIQTHSQLISTRYGISSSPESHPATGDSIEDLDANSALISPSPSTIRLILRTTFRLLRNASHDTKHLYSSMDHIAALLADEHSGIVLLSLEVLNALLHRFHKYRPSRVIIPSDISDRLMHLSTGWGGRENGLGFVECCSSKHADSLPHQGKKVYFEYDLKSETNSSVPLENSRTNVNVRVGQHSNFPERRSSKKSSDTGNSGAKKGICPIPLTKQRNEHLSSSEQNVISHNSGDTASIVIEDVTKLTQSETWLLTKFAVARKVPKTEYFRLLCALRRAKRFTFGRESRLEGALLRLLAISAIFQVQPVPSSSQDLLRREPELLHDIVAIACASSENGLDDIPIYLRTAAIRCLTAICLDRNRINSIVTATGVNVHHGALPTLFRTEINQLLSHSRPEIESTSATGAETAMNIDLEVEQDTQAEDPLSAFSEVKRTSVNLQRFGNIELLLSLVHVLALYGSSFGTNPVAQSGLLPVLIPFLSTRDSVQPRLLSHAISTMYAIIQNSSPSLGSQVFRDNDGLSLLSLRIAQELAISENNSTPSSCSETDEAVELEALRRRGESRIFYEKLGKRQMTASEALQNLPPSSSVASRGLLPHSSWVLLRALLQLLIGAMGSGGSEVRELVLKSELPRALRKVIAQPFLHGGSLFQSAATVTTNIAHAEPTATSELVKAGIATALLRSIDVGLPPCAEAVRCVPNLLAALCLTPSARDTIVSSQPLKKYLMRLATPFYIRSLHGDTPLSIGNSLDELMRHVEALRPSGNEAMLEYLKMAATFITTKINGNVRFPSTVSQRGHTVRNSTRKDETTKGKDGTTKTSKFGSNAGSGGDNAAADVVLLDRMKLGIAHNSCRLAGFSQGSSEHQEGIVKNGGLDYMISLRQATALASPEATIRDGATSSRHFPVPHTVNLGLLSSLRNFSSRHHGPVLKSIFRVILEDATAVLSLSKKLNGAWLPEEEEALHKRKPHGFLNAANSSPVQNRDTLNLLDRAQCEDDRFVASLKASIDAFRDENCNTKSLSTSDAVRATAPRQIRQELSNAIAKLRTDIVILAGLSRGGPGSGASAWESAGGSHVATIVSTVERAARVHLASVYTGMTLTHAVEGDLTTATVTATTDPEMRVIRLDEFRTLFNDVDEAVGFSLSKSKLLEEACKSYKIPPEVTENSRKTVTGLAWQLETFVVACQNLYATLSRGLTFSSRRLSRDPSRYATSARSLAATIGRIFALHLQAAKSLWEIPVITIERRRVIAALDYVRRILVEIRKTIFDEPRRTTQSLVLRSFINAGGAEALIHNIKPLLIVQAAVQLSTTDERENKSAGRGVPTREVDRMLEGNTLSTMSFILAVSDAIKESRTKHEGSEDVTRLEVVQHTEESNAMITTFESISDQARAISKMAVTDSGVQLGQNPEKLSLKLRDIVLSDTQLSAIRSQVCSLSSIGLDRCCDFAVQGVASEAWSTFCRFIGLLASCPGLLGSNSGPDSGEANGWEPQAFQRSTITIAMRLLHTVTDHPETLLTAFKLDGSAMTDILGIIHTISRLENEIGEQEDEPEKSSGPFETVGRPINPVNDSLENNHSSVPSEELINQLVEMGFSRDRAVIAVRNTTPALRNSLSRGLEYAANWLLNNNDSGEDIGSSELERDGSWEANDDNHESHPGNESENQNQAHSEDDGAISAENSPTISQAPNAQDPSSNPTEVTPNENHDDEMMEDRAASPQNMQVTQENQMSINTLTNQPSSLTNATLPDKEPLKETTSRSKSNADTADVSAKVSCMENDDNRPLLRSVQIEMDLLSKALAEVNLIDVKELPAFRSAAERYIGTEKTLGITHQNQQSVLVVPVSVCTFKSQKNKLFKSLKQLALAIINHTEKNENDAQLAFIAVELISILHKGANSDQYKEIGLSELVSKGLQAALEAYEKCTDDMKSSSGCQVATVWAHYGGIQAREALFKSHAYDLSYQSLKNNVAWWHSRPPLSHLDGQIAQPVQHLGASYHVTGSDENMQSSLSENNIKHPTREEIKQLVQTATCLLILDSAIRYERKDKLIRETRLKLANGASNPKTSASAVANDTNVPNIFLRNEHEENLPQDSTNRDRSGGDGGMNHHNQFIRNQIRDFLGSTSSVMDIDKWMNGKAVSSDHQVDDQTTEITEASTKKEKQEKLCQARSEISQWTLSNAASESVLGIPKKQLLIDCMQLLRSWGKMEVGDAMIALLQLLGSLTLDWTIAKYAFENGIVEVLLRLPHLNIDKIRSVDYRVTRALTKTIIRHIIEDPETLTEAMSNEIRKLLGPQTRTRSSMTVKLLISSTSPLVARDITCYVNALSHVVRISDFDAGKVAALADESNQKVYSENRPNVERVVTALSSLLTETGNLSSKIKEPSDANSKVGQSQSSSVAKFALEMLSELVDLSQAVAVSFARVPSSTFEPKGLAIDYIIRHLLPDPLSPNVKTTGVLGMTLIQPDQDNLSEAARKLIQAMCCTVANAYEATVAALARAAKIEAIKPNVSPGLMKGIANCIAPGCKLRVLRAVLQSSLPNDLAKSLGKMNLKPEQNADVASSVLRALTLLGQASTHIARHGENLDEDVSFGDGVRSSIYIRDPFYPIRIRDDEVLMHSSA